MDPYDAKSRWFGLANLKAHEPETRQQVTPRTRKVNRSATDRLKRLIEAELNRQDLTDE